MEFRKLLNFAYRCQRRLVRELRKRGDGVDTKFDAWLYRQTSRQPKGRERTLRWAALAPWGAEPCGKFAVSHWCTPDEAAAVVVAANRACAHEFDLLGSGPFRFGKRIDWHVDFKSGYRWDSTRHYSRIGWGDLPPGVDIKVPWELNRCMHFATLGLADWITGNIRYYEEWKAQVLDWIEANPVGRGVNWTCAMDVAMRAVNWLTAVMLFRLRLEEEADNVFFETLCESLWHHGLHIERNLEWAGPGGMLPGNHFLADLTGLLAIGGLFIETRRGRKWWNFAQGGLEFEMPRQVYADGCNYETSTSYHRMVMEMFLWADTLGQRMKNPFSDAYQMRLGLMADFVSTYSGPNGLAAQFGDNDSGRLLHAGLDDGRDHRYLTKDECGFGGRLNRFLLRGNLPLAGSLPSSNIAFREGGFYFLQNQAAWLALRAGSFELGGAHAHCDQLSLVLSIAGYEVLVDRGTGIYTPDPEKRNRYRSTKSHNTIRVNDWDQNQFGRARHQVFRMQDDTKTSVVRWEPENGIWEAEHSGFEREVSGMCCKRHVRLDRESIEILDTLTALRDGDRIEWFFHFAPGVTIDLDAHQVNVRVGGIEVRLSWNFDAEAQVLNVDHSPAYGVEVPAQCLRLAVSTKNPQTNENFGIGIHWSACDKPSGA